MVTLRSVRRLTILFVLSSLIIPLIIGNHALPISVAQDTCESRPPTPLELAYFSKFVYLDDAGSSVLLGLEDFDGLDESEWQLLLFSDQAAEIGYFGAVYVSRSRCQVVVAHRGTDQWSLLLELEAPTDVDDDWAIVMGAVPEQFTDGVLPFWERISTVLEAQGMTADDGWTTTHTGHSLGAVLAEISGAQFPDATVVTFDSPGSLPIIEAEYGLETAERMNAVSYLGPPNLVNTSNPHVGKIVLVDPAWRAFSAEAQFRTYTGILDPTERLFASLVSYFEYTKQAHSLDRIITQFNPETGLPTIPINADSWWPQSILNGLWYFLFTPTVLQPEPMQQLLDATGSAEADFASVVAQLADAGMLQSSSSLFDLNALIIINACGFDQACIDEIINACLIPALNAFELTCMQRVINGEDVGGSDVVDVIDEDATDTIEPTPAIPSTDIDTDESPTDDSDDGDGGGRIPDLPTIGVDTDGTEPDIAVDGDEGEPENMLDIVFVIDTTSSMADDISEVKREAVNIINRVADSGTSWRIGIVTFRDHPVAPYGDPTDYAARVDLDFTNNRNDIVNTVNLIAVDGGGDEPEAVFSGLMTAIDFLWRDGAKKALILMGDAPPHDPEPRTSYTMSQVLRAAFDVDPANIYAILIENSPSTRLAFQSLADGSSGQLVNASSASAVVDAIFETITSITEDPELVSVLTVGSTAIVNIPDEQYGLRLGPGSEYSLSENLEPGTPVEITGEPEFNGVHIWWPIRSLTSGYEGWTVEAVDGVVTLIPDEDVTPSSRPEIDCSVSASANVNRREFPSTTAAVTQQLPARTEMAVEGYNVGGDQLVWFWLADGSWIRSDVVDADGNCDELPQVRPWLNNYPVPAGFEPPGVRTSAPTNSIVLNGGRGLSNGAVQNNGDMQVEGYCNRLGYGIAENGVDWFCTMNNSQPAFTLGARDFDAICRETYDNPRAVAIQDGSGSAWAYRWRCHEVR